MDAKNPMIEKYELIKEIHYIFDNDVPKIKGRIYKILLGANAQYTWEINYYCRLANEVTVYTPSAPFADSETAIQSLLDKYVKRFENAVDWVENENY